MWSASVGLDSSLVDTHVERILSTTYVKKSATPLEVEKWVMDVLPKEECWRLTKL